MLLFFASLIVYILRQAVYFALRFPSWFVSIVVGLAECLRLRVALSLNSKWCDAVASIRRGDWDYGVENRDLSS